MILLEVFAARCPVMVMIIRVVVVRRMLAMRMTVLAMMMPRASWSVSKSRLLNAEDVAVIMVIKVVVIFLYDERDFFVVINAN